MYELDAESLRWEDGVDPADVFFINEGAADRNQLFFTVNGGEKQMIFADISSTESVTPELDGPLALGDGVTLGTFIGDTSLDFLIKGNGARNINGQFYGANAAQNSDGLQHVVAYEYFDTVLEQSWVILGFEDRPGERADRDFNDVVIAVRGIVGERAVDVPEPASALGLLAVSGLMGLSRRRDD